MFHFYYFHKTFHKTFERRYNLGHNITPTFVFNLMILLWICLLSFSFFYFFIFLIFPDYVGVIVDTTKLTRTSIYILQDSATHYFILLYITYW